MMQIIINIHIKDWIKDIMATNLFMLLNWFLMLDDKSWKDEPINCGNEFKNDIWNAEKPRNTAKTDI